MQEHGIDEAAVDGRILRKLGHLEKLLWVGTPPAAFTLRPTDALYVLGPILLVVFTAAVGMGIPWFFYLFPFAFVISVLLAKFERMNTVYALTDRQVIIVGHLLGRSERILKLIELVDLKLDERSDGSGRITFGGWGRHQYISDIAPSTDKTPPRVELGPGARQVFELFEKAREAARFRARG